MTDKEFIHSCPSHLKKRYQTASDLSSIGREDVHDNFSVESFLKSEKTAIAYSKDYRDVVGRVVSPRKTVGRLMQGLFIKPMEKPIYSALAKLCCTDKVVFKGMNAIEAGECIKRKWDKFNQPVALGLDARRFDQHCSYQAISWEHSVYKALLARADKPQFSKVMKHQLHNKCTWYTQDGYTLKYETEGTRMSGDMNTGLGNCLLMVCLVERFCYEQNIKFELCNNGDDCVVICDKQDEGKLEKVHEWFYDFGYDLTVEKPVYELEHIDFCQTRPVFVGSRGYVMCRDPLIAMAKDTLMLHVTPDYKGILTWLYTVGVGGLSLTDGMPVMPQFYAAMLKNNPSATNWKNKSLLGSGFSFLAKGMKYSKLSVTEEARHSFWLAFGLLPCDQIKMEKDLERSEFYLGGTPPEGITNTQIEFPTDEYFSRYHNENNKHQSVNFEATKTEDLSKYPGYAKYQRKREHNLRH
jgi:hypothetical protein